MTAQFLNYDYWSAFDSSENQYTIFAFSKWIASQGGKVGWSWNDGCFHDYFTFQKESDAVMFVLKWGAK